MPNENNSLAILHNAQGEGGRAAALDPALLAAFGRHAAADPLYSFSDTRAAFEDFGRRMQALKPGRSVRWLEPARLHQASEAGTIVLPDAGMSPHAWARERAGARGYSLIGSAGPFVSAATVAQLFDLAVAPVRSWDALVCGSQAVRQALEGEFARIGAYVEARFGAKRFETPHLRVIPGGIDSSQPTPATRAGMRAKLRAQLKLSEETVAFLFVGRLAFHSNAHPVPMMAALRLAARRTGKPAALIFCGQFPRSNAEAEWRRVFAMYEPDVKLEIVDSGDDQAAHGAWYAADAYLSLADNVQNTTGAAVMTAMAAGLPVVASDWGGTREIVRPDETGMLVPTSLSPEFCGESLAQQYETGRLSYDRYIAYCSASTAADVRAASDACAALIVDPLLRARLGAEGAKRGAAFDWSAVVAGYEALAGDLAELRRGHRLDAYPGSVSARVPNPLVAFRGFATGVVGLNSRVDVIDAQGGPDPLALADTQLCDFVFDLRCSRRELEQVWTVVRERPGSRVAGLVGALREVPPERLFACLQWLAKFGYIDLSDQD